MIIIIQSETMAQQNIIKQQSLVSQLLLNLIKYIKTAISAMFQRQGNDERLDAPNLELNYDEDEEVVVSEDVYQVEDILNSKVQNGHKFYKIKWKGYSYNETTWQPQSHLPSPMILYYENKVKQKKILKKQRMEAKKKRLQEAAEEIRQFVFGQEQQQTNRINNMKLSKEKKKLYETAKIIFGQGQELLSGNAQVLQEKKNKLKQVLKEIYQLDKEQDSTKQSLNSKKTDYFVNYAIEGRRLKEMIQYFPQPSRSNEFTILGIQSRKAMVQNTKIAFKIKKQQKHQIMQRDQLLSKHPKKLAQFYIRQYNQRQLSNQNK